MTFPADKLHRIFALQDQQRKSKVEQEELAQLEKEWADACDAQNAPGMKWLVTTGRGWRRAMRLLKAKGGDVLR